MAERDIDAPAHSVSPPRRSPEKPKMLKGYQPCINPDDESPQGDQRKAYRKIERNVGKGVYDCGTVGPDYTVKLWNLTETPVKLTKVDESITFFYQKELELEFPHSHEKNTCTLA